MELDATVTDDPGLERVTLHLDGTLPAGSAEIHLAFDGTLNDQLVGFYRSTFDLDGATTALAVTQFESTHARRAFPCFDEPDMKATFAITLVVDSGLLAVSNAAEVDRAGTDDGRVRIRFADTMPMSTYLVAFVVGPLEATEVHLVAGTAGPIPLRIVHPPGSAHLCSFALEVADAGLRFLERYYDLPYPGDKVDLVAVPDFAFGAMENLGCITFREVLLLVDPERATQQELQRVADVINHELAHMWFGDLVTMGWWNGIWLNEAFATFMEVAATDSFRPEWDCWTSFGLARAEAFDTDALHATRPIEFPVHSPADAEAMFDVLTYEKGASVVRMLEQYLGAEPFRAGISEYLRRHAYANTETTDLWDALEEATGEPVRRIMDAWIFRGGHPRVVVTPTEDGVRLAQERASYDRPDSTDSTDSTDHPDDNDGAATWPVPMVVTARVDDRLQHHRVLLEDPVDLALGGRPTAVQANTGGSGFYRTVLPVTTTASLAVGEDTSPLERFVLVDDAWAALLAGRSTLADVESVLRLAAWRETDPSVWRRLAGAARGLRRLLGHHTPSLGHRARDLARDMADGPLANLEVLLGTLTETDRDRWEDLRGVLVSLLGTVGQDASTRLLARELFLAGAGTGPSADAALEAAALDVVAATGDADDHAAIEARWRSSATPQEEIRYLYALADTPVPELFDRTLVLARTEVRSQNAPYLLRRALAHPDLADRAWDDVSGHWDELVERFPSSSLPRMLEGVRSVTDPTLAGRIAAFLGQHPLPGGELVVAQHIERMHVTAAVAARLRSGEAGEPG